MFRAELADLFSHVPMFGGLSLLQKFLDKRLSAHFILIRQVCPFPANPILNTL